MSQAIISLKPRYAKLVVSGEKTVELRNRMVRLRTGTLIWIYATRPMARIVGTAELELVVHAEPAEIWRRFGEDICVDKGGFDSYIGNRDRVSALVLRSAKELGNFMTLDRMRQSVHAFQPPQFYARVPGGSRLRVALDIIREAEEGVAWRGGAQDQGRARGASGTGRAGEGQMKRPQKLSKPKGRVALDAAAALGAGESARMEARLSANGRG